MIKIVGGKYRSRIIDTPDSNTLPTKNMVREAIASALGYRVEGAKVLDLFAGSGAVGIELASRGAKEIVFNDASLVAAKIVKGNIAKLQIQGTRVLNNDYKVALEILRNDKFDIVFVDPPYAIKESYSYIVNYLLDNNMLNEGASIILEYEGEITFDEDKFSFIKEYKYGKTKVKIIRI